MSPGTILRRSDPRAVRWARQVNDIGGANEESYCTAHPPPPPDCALAISMAKTTKCGRTFHCASGKTKKKKRDQG